MAAKKLDPKPFFILGVIAILFIGGWLILGGGETREYPGFAQCLANQDATMYGFDLCPNCNKQKDVIGRTAFNTYIADTGRYVKCRPQEEADKQIGDRLQNITVLPQYRDQFTRETTQEDLCTRMVAEGTPTWLIPKPDGSGVHQVAGWRTITELAELSGCPVPETYENGGVEDSGDRVTRENETMLGDQ